MHGRGARRQRGMAAVSARDADTGPALSSLSGVFCTPTHPGVRTHILLEVGTDRQKKGWPLWLCLDTMLLLNSLQTDIISCLKGCIFRMVITGIVNNFLVIMRLCQTFAF